MVTKESARLLYIVSRRLFWSGDRQLYVGNLDTTYYESITTYAREEPTALTYDGLNDVLYVSFPDRETGGSVVTKLVVSERTKSDVFKSVKPITSLLAKPNELVFTDEEVLTRYLLWLNINHVVMCRHFIS